VIPNLSRNDQRWSWSVSVPRQVAVIGKISPEFQIIEASWLRRKAPL